MCVLMSNRKRTKYTLDVIYFIVNCSKNINVMRNKEATQNKSKSHENIVTFVFRKLLHTRLAISVISMAFAQNCSLLDPSKTVMIFDGCFRSQLRTRIKDPDKCVPHERIILNETDPLLVRNIHLDFLNAGANILRTNTYWATESYINRICSTKYKGRCVDLIRKGVFRAREAVNTIINQQSDEKTYFIVGSCGSATNTNRRIDKSNRKKIKDFHRLRVQTLVHFGVAALAFESIESAEEAHALVELMGEFPNTKAFMSFRMHNYSDNTLRYGGNIYETARNCCDSLQSQLIAIGVNCCYPEQVKNCLSNFNESRKRQNAVPLAVYPRMYQSHLSEELFDFAKLYSVSEWPTMGASYIGGCCQMLSQDIGNICSKITSLHQFSST